MRVTTYPTVLPSPGMAAGAPAGVYEDAIHKFGYNPDIDTTTDPEAIWPVGGTITWPSSAATASISSSSTNDDGAPPGTGAQTLFVQGVDGSFARDSETITMDGTTTVTTTNSYLYIDRMYVVASGSVGTNDGNITATIGGNTVAYIPAGIGQTLQAMMVVPAVTGKTPYLLSVWCGVWKATGAFADMILYRTPDGESKRAQDRISIHSESGGFSLQYTTPQALAGGDRLWWECNEISTNDCQVHAGFEIGWI